MDWNAAIDKNREALKRVLAALVAMAGLGSGQSAIGIRQSRSEPAQTADGSIDCPLPTADCLLLLPRHLHRAVLRLLRPAEAAARRLVIAGRKAGNRPCATLPASLRRSVFRNSHPLPCRGEPWVSPVFRTPARGRGILRRRQLPPPWGEA